MRWMIGRGDYPYSPVLIAPADYTKKKTPGTQSLVPGVSKLTVL